MVQDINNSSLCGCTLVRADQHWDEGYWNPVFESLVTSGAGPSPSSSFEALSYLAGATLSELEQVAGIVASQYRASMSYETSRNWTGWDAEHVEATRQLIWEHRLTELVLKYWANDLAVALRIGRGWCPDLPWDKQEYALGGTDLLV